MALSKKPGRKVVALVVVLILVLVVGGAALGFYMHQKSQASNSGDEVTTLSVQVGKLIELPSETPKVATVSDITKLVGQPFFAHAQNGDKVLIYENANKAILYRPSINKIVEVAYYNPAKASVAPTGATQKVRVAIYNGTKTEGLAKTEGSSLTSKHPNLVINNTANASGDYSKTVVVDVTGSNSALVKALAGELNGEVKPLPNVEAKPDADILIILGQ